MSQFKQAAESPISWDRIIAFISLVFAALMYFNGTVVVNDTPVGIGCSGFLIKDPPPEMLITTILSKEEKIYIEEKINCSRDRIQKDPKDAAAYTNIGEAERRLGNLAAARRSHQKALELKPNSQEAKIGLALVEEDMGHEVAASQAMQGALALNPNGIAYLYQGTILHKQNDMKGAEKAWRTAKELDPKIQKVIRTWRLFNLKVNWSLLFR